MLVPESSVGTTLVWQGAVSGMRVHTLKMNYDMNMQKLVLWPYILTI